MINIKKKLTITIFFIATIFYFFLYSSVNNDVFRGEIWELLFIHSQNISTLDKLKQTSQFVCFGSGRFQPLAFFVPVLPIILFKSSFAAVHIFAQVLHLICCFASALIILRWTKKMKIALVVFLISLFSFLASDVIIWNFFTYIQLHALIIILCMYSVVQYYDNSKFRYYIFGSFFAIFSAYMYEAGISILIAQIVYALFRYSRVSFKRFSLELIIPSIFLMIYLGTSLLINGLNYKDSNTVFHLVVFFKHILYFIYYLRYNIGLSVSPHIENIGWISGIELNFTFLNILILPSLILTLAIFTSKFKQYQFNNKSIFIILLTYFYISIIAFGRVPAGSGVFQPTGLETQFRYYYVVCFLLPILLGLMLNHLNFSKIQANIMISFVSLLLIGNAININKYIKEISLYNDPLTKHANKLLIQINPTNNELNFELQKLFWNKMHKDWYEGSIETPSSFSSFTFNANKCHIHQEYSRLNGVQKY